MTMAMMSGSLSVGDEIWNKKARSFQNEKTYKLILTNPTTFADAYSDHYQPLVM
jgi:hypothetical protein